MSNSWVQTTKEGNSSDTYVRAVNTKTEIVEISIKTSTKCTLQRKNIKYVKQSMYHQVDWGTTQRLSEEPTTDTERLYCCIMVRAEEHGSVPRLYEDALAIYKQS